MCTAEPQALTCAQGIDFYTTITRARFEELNMDLFRHCMEPVEKVLRVSAQRPPISPPGACRPSRCNGQAPMQSQPGCGRLSVQTSFPATGDPGC